MLIFLSLLNILFVKNKLLFYTLLYKQHLLLIFYITHISIMIMYNDICVIYVINLIKC